MQTSPRRTSATSYTQAATPVRPSAGVGRPVSTPGTAERSSKRRTGNDDSVFTRQTGPTNSTEDHSWQPPQPPVRRLLSQSNELHPFQQNQNSVVPALGSQNRTCRETTARPAQPTSQSTPMTTTQMLEELRKKSYEQLWRHGTNDEYILHNVAVIGSSPEVGFKSSLSRDEIEEAYGPEGLITSHIARSQKLHDRSQNRPTKAKKISQVSGVLYELVRSVYCNVAHGTDEACQVQGVIFRFQHESSNTRGLLYYAKCNPLNGLIIDHSSHHLFPGEIAKLECKSAI